MQIVISFELLLSLILTVGAFLLLRFLAKKMLEAFADIEDYSLRHSIWMSRIVPTIIAVIIFVLTVIYFVHCCQHSSVGPSFIYKTS